MKASRKIKKKFSLLLLTGMILSSAYLLLAASVPISSAETAPIRLQDDFYQAVNKDWMNTAQLKPGYSAYDSFTEVSDRCLEQIQTIFNLLSAHEASYPKGSVERNILTYYHDYLDTASRDRQQTAPIENELNAIKNLSSLKALTTYISTVPHHQSSGLYSLYVETDLKDSSKNSLYLASGSLLLGDADHYTKPTAYSKKLETATTDFLRKLLVLTGCSKEEAELKVDQAYNWDHMIAPYMIGQEEASKCDNLHERLYHIYTIEELDKTAPHLQIREMLKNLGISNVDKIIVQEPKWLTAFNSAYKEENLPLLKNYIELSLIRSASNALSSDFAQLNDEYTAQLTGAKGTLPLEQRALLTIQKAFAEPVGKLYVEKYFTQKEKKDVQNLVQEILSTYKKKIAAVDWMTPSTKQHALKKLDTMGIKIGYPDKWEDYTGLQLVSYHDGGSLFENNAALIQYNWSKNIAKLHRPVDKSKFIFSPQTVNACYCPTANDLTFPAAILQPPFYDYTRSREANLGAIGAVIGHEISHAFDTTGANFDENGNMKNWWTEEDYARFSEKTQAVRAFYNQVRLESGEKVNGDLTVGENIADITSISCMLDILKTMEHPDYDSFFRSWASIWREIAAPQYTSYIIQTSVHSPNKVRVNTVLSQFQAFYDTYHITETDKMYINPAYRLKIY